MSETLRTPARVPLAVGLKVTLMVQDVPTVKTALQVWVWEKSPLTVMLERKRVAVPVFLSVTLWGLLLVPTGIAANVRVDGERVAPGPTPVPMRPAV